MKRLMGCFTCAFRRRPHMNLFQTDYLNHLQNMFPAVEGGCRQNKHTLVKFRAVPRIQRSRRVLRHTIMCANKG